METPNWVIVYDDVLHLIPDQDNMGTDEVLQKWLIDAGLVGICRDCNIQVQIGHSNGSSSLRMIGLDEVEISLIDTPIINVVYV